MRKHTMHGSCDRDEPFLKGFPDEIALEQSLTIMEGKSGCGFVYRVKKWGRSIVARAAPLGESLKGRECAPAGSNFDLLYVQFFRYFSIDE
jgi:hypothetical protein